MRVGIDLHGVIDNDPEWFKYMLGWVFLDLDFVNIYIISGPPKKDIEAELKKLGVYQFHGIYSVVDHLKEKGAEMWQDERGRWWTHDKIWWKAKAEICDRYKIDVMIDDKKEWGDNFKNIKTKFLLYGG